MKLHLGCGSVIIPDYINIDINYIPGVDDIADIRYLHPRKYPANSADVIYASHVLEHINKWDYEAVLKRWYKILKPGGILRLALPDFEQLVQVYIETKDLKLIYGPLYGGQDSPGNTHYWCWDFQQLKSVLESVGFQRVNRYDWRETEHAHIDDNSQAYIPHMQKETGRLISLNVEAIK